MDPIEIGGGGRGGGREGERETEKEENGNRFQHEIPARPIQSDAEESEAKWEKPE